LNYGQLFLFVLNYTMVKNKGGGKHKHRKKNPKVPAVAPRLRAAKADDEIYAKVRTMYGNGMAEVICNDMVVRLLIIRKKFTGRNRRDNSVSIDTMVLAGLRTWEVRAAKKKQKADLLCVYSGVTREDLEKLPGMNPRILPGASDMSQSKGPYEFSHETDHMVVGGSAAETNIKLPALTSILTDDNADDEGIDFDDI